MNKKFSIGLIILMLVLSIFPFISGIDNSRVLAVVDDQKITQHDVDMTKKDSEYSQRKDVSDKEVLDKIINNHLLLVRAKELNITVSDEELDWVYGRLNYRGNDKTDKGKKNMLEALRVMLTIEKARKKLGDNVGEELRQLKQRIKIEYYI